MFEKWGNETESSLSGLVISHVHTIYYEKEPEREKDELQDSEFIILHGFFDHLTCWSWAKKKKKFKKQIRSSQLGNKVKIKTALFSLFLGHRIAIIKII